MLNSLESLIKELQVADDARKKRWLVGASAVTMTLVLILWAGYLKISIKPVEAGETGARESAGTFAILKRGAGILYANFSAIVKEKISRRKEFDIEKDSKFQAEELPELLPREIK